MLRFFSDTFDPENNFRNKSGQLCCIGQWELEEGGAPGIGSCCICTIV